MDINLSIEDDRKQKYQSVTSILEVRTDDPMFFTHLQATAYGADESEARSNLRSAVTELIAALNSTLEKIEQKQIH